MDTNIIEKLKIAKLLNRDNKVNSIKIKWLDITDSDICKLIVEINNYTKTLDICPNITLSLRIKAILLDILLPQYCMCGKLCAFSGYRNSLFKETCSDRNCINVAISDKHLHKGIEPVKKFKITQKNNQIQTLYQFKHRYYNNEYTLLNTTILKEFIKNSTYGGYNKLVDTSNLKNNYNELLSILFLTSSIEIDFSKIVNMSWAQRFYHIQYNITDIPKCIICNKNNVMFSNYLIGYGNKKVCNNCKFIFSGFNRRINQIDIIKKYLEIHSCELIINELSDFGLNRKPLLIKDNRCNHIYEKWLNNGKIILLKDRIICPICNPNNAISALETKLFDYIRTLNIDVEQSNRTIIDPLELDIVIPSKKIAIEFNGNYWHSEICKIESMYHLNKTNSCKDVGYRLIHIFEDEWVNKCQIVKARLRNILGYTKKHIYARRCIIKEIDNEIKNKFLTKYHIQDKDNSAIKLGLFYKNRLVSVMTFGKRRFDNKEGFELMRYCTIANFNIVGGAGKLLSYFRKNYNTLNLPIISYADKRWSIGNLYKQLGFTLTHESSPGYFYIKNNDILNRLSRYQFQKHLLKGKLEIFDGSLTEVENMKNNGYTRIWDCGNYVFELN